MTNPEDRFAPPSSARDSADDEPTVATPVVDPGESAAGAPPGPPAAPPPGPSAAPSGGSTTRTAVLSVLATLVAIGVVAGAFFIGRSGDSTPTTTEPPETTTTVPETTTTAAPEPVDPEPVDPEPVAPAPVGDVRGAPAGLLCKDLAAQGYSYSAAVDYWRLHGQPNRMDADKNGIPCETVYPRSDVVAYWPSSTYGASVSYGLPSGLLCRDLQARGVGVYDALRYYIWEGYPSRMDADGNGIPCETVYPDAAAIWLWEF